MNQMIRLPLAPDIPVVSGDIPIYEEHFLDANFRAYLSEILDKDNNGMLNN